MARDFTKNTSNRMSLGTSEIGPLINGARATSFGAIVTFDTLAGAGNNDRVLSFFVSGSNAIVLGVDNGTMYAAGRSQTTDSYQKSAAGSISTGTEYHIAGVLDYPADSIRPYLDGVQQADDGVTFGSNTYNHGTPSQVDMIGSIDDSPTTNSQVDGRISEVCLYRGDIGTDGFAQLADRISPEMVRRELLVAYWPLLGNASPEIERINRKQGTIVGSVPKALHPRIIYPRRRSTFLPVVVAADIDHVAALADSFDNVVQRRPIKVTNF